MNVEIISLRKNHTISRVVKGGWQLAGDHGDFQRRKAIQDMEIFLEAGISTFDCADIYTGVEEMLGEFISSIRQNHGSSKAEEICIHTKLVPDLTRLHDIQPNEIEAIVDRSLRRLRIDQLHLVQFFWWDLKLGKPVETLQILKKLQDKGKIKNLGVTNWEWFDIKPFIDSGMDIISAQVQYSILDHRPKLEMVPWAKEKNVSLLCYGTLAGGFISEAWLGKEDPGFQFSNRSLIKYRLIIDEFGSWDKFQDLLQTLKEIGDSNQVTLSSVAIRYILDQPQVGAAIVGARYAKYLDDTLEVFRFSLSSKEHKRIKEKIDVSNGPSGPVYGLERDRTGRHGRIMKYNLNTLPTDKILAESSRHD
jgi:aryl-alcohol dehydrogenase-like predicted oxidoreductase